MKFGVTGAGGYVGGVIVKHLRREGHEVYEFKRSSVWQEDPFWVPYDLSHELRQEDFVKLDGLVHCAYDFRPSNWKEIYRVNVEGSLRLFNAAREAGVKKVIFISSMSAFDGVKSMYGKAKLELEREAALNHFQVLRPGLVFGAKPGGMVGGLLKMVNASKCVPLIHGGKQIFYLTHEEDLFKLVYSCLFTNKPSTSRPILAAHSQGFTFKSILGVLARYQNKQISFISIPWQPAFWALKTAELFRFPIGFRSDSLISFLNQDPHPDFSLTRTAGVPFREFNIITLSN